MRAYSLDGWGPSGDAWTAKVKPAGIVVAMPVWFGTGVEFPDFNPNSTENQHATELAKYMRLAFREPLEFQEVNRPKFKIGNHG